MPSSLTCDRFSSKRQFLAQGLNDVASATAKPGNAAMLQIETGMIQVQVSTPTVGHTSVRLQYRINTVLVQYSKI